MDASGASFEPDGSCRFADEIDGTETVWASVSHWADDWLAEWRVHEHGAACDFIAAACDEAAAGVVDALVVLGEAAAGDEELAWVGAGPLEHLVSHSGHGLRVLADMDRAAWQHVAFRAALSNTWLGSNVPESVRDRLGQLGARVLS